MDGNGKRGSRTTRRARGFTIPGAGILLLLLLLYARWIEPTRLQVTHLYLQSPKLAPAQQPITIVQLSDLHMRTLSPFYQKVAHVTNSFAPDLVVITGDLIGSSRWLAKEHSQLLHSTLASVARFVGLLKAPHGVFVVRGNNELVAQKELNNTVLDALRAAGATVLCNQHQRVEVNSVPLYVLGADFFSFHPALYADFTVERHDGTCLMRAGRSLDNAYSHYVGPGSRDWQNYECAGAMSYSGSGEAGVGVTVYSAFGSGEDRFYRLRWREGLSGIRLDAHGSPVNPVTIPFSMEPEKWYRFRLQAESLEDRTVVKAKAWEEGYPEPLSWQLVLVDTCRARLTRGTVGLWSHGEGLRRFKDLRVVDTRRDSLLLAAPSCHSGPDPEGWLDFALEREGIRAAAHGIPHEAFTLLLAHSPDMVRPAEDLGIDLVLAGHTHGGQVRLPLVGALYTQTLLGRRYAAGLFSFGTTKLYVNRGIGNAFVPFRFLCRPEITVIHLLPGANPENRLGTNADEEARHGIPNGH
ncbi:MAG: metallophosphoesterase [candidate division KSB1 bacterium]|nr:metallophosphoesterase [candidate division KSB1 bacterium]